MKFPIKFIPEKGATISDLRLKRPNIYDNYKSFEDLDTLEWGRGVLLAPFPNRLKKGEYSLDLEPMTCNVDAFNNGEGLKTLRPNEIIELECRRNFR